LKGSKPQKPLMVPVTVLLFSDVEAVFTGCDPSAVAAVSDLVLGLASAVGSKVASNSELVSRGSGLRVGVCARTRPPRKASGVTGMSVPPPGPST